MSVRPTGDRVRQAWMNILQNDLPGARALDLFSGSGALGLEALSRGARSVDFVESSTPSLEVLRGNVERLAAGQAAHIHRVDALDFINNLEPGAYDIAFADPPYHMDLAGRVVERWLASHFADVLSVEHSRTELLPAGGDGRRYGDTSVTFYRVDGARRATNG